MRYSSPFKVEAVRDYPPGEEMTLATIDQQELAKAN